MSWKARPSRLRKPCRWGFRRAGSSRRYCRDRRAGSRRSAWLPLLRAQADLASPKAAAAFSARPEMPSRRSSSASTSAQRNIARGQQDQQVEQQIGRFPDQFRVVARKARRPPFPPLPRPACARSRAGRARATARRSWRRDRRRGAARSWFRGGSEYPCAHRASMRERAGSVKRIGQRPVIRPVIGGVIRTFTRRRAVATRATRRPMMTPARPSANSARLDGSGTCVLAARAPRATARQLPAGSGGSVAHDALPWTICCACTSGERAGCPAMGPPRQRHIRP